LGKFNIGSQAIDYQIYHRVQAKSRADLDEMAFLEAVRHLIQEGGQNAAVGISLESPRRIYVASHNRPIFVVRRLENDDFMVVSDINAAMGLFPQALIHRKTSQLTKLREQRHKALDELKASRAKKETIQACEVKYRRKEEKLIEAFRVAIYPFDGEEIFARIETKFEENNLRRGVSITDFDGNPLPEIESFLTILSPTAIRNDIYKSYFETHLHEIPERLTEILQSYVPEDDSCPDFQIREALFSRRFGRKWAGLKRIILVGMGSAYHMATIARSYFKKLLPEMEVMVLMPVEVDDPTKFIVPETDLVVLLSWSATTANMVAFAKSLEADKPVMVAITEKGFADMALIARRSGGVIPILSGEEVTITGIKSTQCMLFCIFLFAIWLAFKKGRIKAALSCLKRLQRVPETVLQILSDETLEKFSKNLASQSAKSYAAVVLDALESTGSAREIASKLEETSWTAIGKPLDYRNLYTKVLKPDLNKNLVLVNATHKARFNDGLDAMKVLHEQGIPFAAVSYPNRALAQIEHYSQGNFVLLPKVEDVLQPFVDLAFYYRFAFHYGLAHGRNAEDFPRNRVKSVTATRSLPRLIVSAAAELHLMEQRDSTATSADSVSLSLAEESAWELDSNIAWEKRYYREMRRLAKGLQSKDPISTFLKLPAKNSAHLTEAFLNAISKEGEIIFIALDRRSDATARTLVANWRRILECRMRVTNADFAPIAFSDNSIFIFLAAEKPDEEMLLKRVRKYSLPHVWVGPQLSKEPALFFNHSAGYYILKKEFGLSQADALYAGVSLLIENSWKKNQPSKATILRNHLRGSGSVIHSLLNDASIKNILMQAMTANRIYKSAFFLGPPIGTGTIWVDRFSQIKGPIMEFHSFGESVHGPIVTVDSSVEDKYIKLEDRKQMVLTYGKNNVLQWEERCLGGTKIDNFLSQPLDDQSTGINTPFFAEGSWYLPVLRNDYDPANDNLIIIDATSERYFAQAIDELASYACRYARMIVISQEAFRNDLTKKVLHTYPISHLIEVPAMKGNNSERIPISDFILPFSMNLLGVAMAAANC
jgi:glucosamine 6-phosphate synthetase-like amidotransferase/phosphosugar isomerase protein